MADKKQKKTQAPSTTSGNNYSAFSAANAIEKRKYKTYQTMVETAGGKSRPLPFNAWKNAGMPAQ